jgi:hypothetical protein
MGAFKLQQMVNMHCQLSFRGSREYKISYFGHKISTFDYFYGGNLGKKWGFITKRKKKCSFWGYRMDGKVKMNKIHICRQAF